MLKGPSGICSTRQYLSPLYLEIFYSGLCLHLLLLHAVQVSYTGCSIQMVFYVVQVHLQRNCKRYYQ